MEELVLGRIAGIDNGGAIAILTFTDGSTFTAVQKVDRHLEGHLVICWVLPDADWGIEEVELEGDLVRFIRHCGGEIGFGIDFDCEVVDLKLLQFFGLEVRLPELVPI